MYGIKFEFLVVIFDGMESGEMLDFVGFYRSGYRTKNVDLGVGTTDVPFLAIEHLF